MKALQFLLFGTLLSAFPSAGAAQSHPYEDLLILYVDEEYPKCVQRAERYTDRANTHRDALPYLYASMCYFEMSKIPKYQEMAEYKHADREALKWAAKFRRKDKNNEFFPNYEDYWTSLNTVAQEMGINLLEQQQYSKAKTQFQRITRYNPENPGAWQMLALAQAGMNNKRDAAESMKKYQEALDAVPNIAQLPVDQRKLLRAGLILSAEDLLQAGRLDSARATVAVGDPYFLDNAEFKALYDELAGPGGQ